MTTAVYTHPDCLEHDTGPGHPERIARLQVVLDALKTSGVAEQLQLEDAPLADEAHLHRVHQAAYVRAIHKSAPVDGWVRLDPDTVMSPGSLPAALRAAGAGIAAADAVMAGAYRTAFCAVRPPGHHATGDTAMGFCLFNNVAVAALHALQQHHVPRLAIVDFDVHHGNGTQAIVEGDERILFVSTHQSPCYPGTGSVAENRPGHILNFPLPPGTDGPTYRELFGKSVIPELERFAPELLMVSAGFDAHRDDPLAELRLVDDDYRWIGEQLGRFAKDRCSGRIISCLEGGYNLEALGRSVVAYLDGISAGV